MKSSGIHVSSLVFAMLVIAAGVLLFAFNVEGGLPDTYKNVVFSWPMLLVAIGFVCFFSRSKWFFGLILVLLGGFFLLPKIPGINLEKQIIWAGIVTVAGIGILCKVLFQRSSFWKNANFFTHFSFWDKPDENWKVYSSGETYKSGSIDRNCVFGGIELDLSEAQLAEGVHHLELNSVFGGIVLYVPVDWRIEINKTQVFGAFVDNRPKPNFEVNENKLLIIEANAVFGGGEIKCR